jgi:formylglycine-generating enzyme required for sulfatase activity
MFTRFGILAIIVFLITSVSGQQRGLTPINVTIGGKVTKLYEQSHALVIGISGYDQYGHGWEALRGVKADVTAVKAALEMNGFNVEVLNDANKEQIDRAISNFISRHGMQLENRLLIYYAGHGHTLPTSYGEQLGYIVPVDAPHPTYDQAGFQSKAIEMAQIEIYARRIQSKHALFVFDACFAGSLFNMRSPVSEAITQRTTHQVRQFITSGSAFQQVPDESIFRKMFVAALTTDEADVDKDGYLTGSELGDFLYKQVVNYSYNSQTPMYGKIRNPNLDKGDFVFELPWYQNKDTLQADASTATPDTTRVQSAVISSKETQKGNKEIEPEKPVRREEVAMVPSAVPTAHRSETMAPAVVVGHLMISSPMAGDLYVNGVFNRVIQPNSPVPMRGLPAGKIILELRGKETWSMEVEVRANDLVNVKFEAPETMLFELFSLEISDVSFQMSGIRGTAVPTRIDGRDTIIQVPDFAIMCNEVTVWQFRKFIEETGYLTDADRRTNNYSSFVLRNNSRSAAEMANWSYSSEGVIRSSNTYNHPVVHVSWNDAMAFAAWLSEKSGKRWRLPTEAEWEYAAKGGEQYLYAGSDTLDAVGWHWRNSNRGTQAVGQKKPNHYGLYDMSGNVREWCIDEVVSPVDAASGLNGSVIKRPVRGGSSDVMEQFCRVTSRELAEPSHRNHSIGFRLIYTP